MKRSIFIMSALILTIFFSLNSCEKQEIFHMGSKTQQKEDVISDNYFSDRDFVHHFYASTGWIYCWFSDETVLDGELCGWFWRSYTGGDCEGFSGSCLPDIVIREYDGQAGGMRDYPQGLRLSDESVKYIEKLMRKLAKAVEKGPHAVKKFYFHQGGKEFFGFKEEIENDLLNDIITIREFNGQYLVVYYDATDPDDGPDYDSD